MKVFIGIILSVIFVLTTIGVSTYFEKSGKMSGEGTRKLVHIVVSNWWFIAMAFFETGWSAAIVPLMFIVVNYVSYKKQIFTSIERGEGAGDLGTVYYAIALFVLAFWTFSIGRPEIGGIGILTMGYADGFAAVIGKRYGKTKLIYGKTIEGTLTNIVMAFAVAMFFNIAFGMGLTLSSIALITIVATFLELFTPLGFDNLSVPIGVSLLVYFIG